MVDVLMENKCIKSNNKSLNIEPVHNMLKEIPFYQKRRMIINVAFYLLK